MSSQTTALPKDFSAKTRNDNLGRLEQETFDLLIIGGGITGAGIVREAVRRGYKVALLEKGDFAGGASSKSSKLIHGGLRYLAALKFGLVFDACRQRRQLLNLAPHLVWPLPFVLPVYQDSPRPWWQIRTAMWLYDALTAFRIPANGHSWPAHQIWSAGQILDREPLLNSHGLVKAARYFDCGTDDARLTLVTLIDAHRQGAILANYAKVTGLLQTTSRVTGVQVRDRRNGAEIEVQARLVVSAVGPWTDKFLRLARGPGQRWLHPTKGVHLVVRRERLPCQAALTFNAPRDGRFMFLVPWGNHTIIGTTDTDYDGDPDNVLATSADVAYILEAVQRAFPSAGLNENDVISTYAGLRPLIKENGNSRCDTPSTYNRSRSHQIRQVRPGLIAVAGGKFTTHRTMAAEVVKEAARILARDHHRSPSGFKNGPHSPLPGGNIADWDAYQTQQKTTIAAGAGLPVDVAEHLVTTYGTEVTPLLMLLLRRPSLAERLTSDLPVIKAQVVHAIRHEMALTLEDVLARRMPVMACAVDQGVGIAESVGRWLAAELGWTVEERVAQVATYRHQVAMSRRWRDEGKQSNNVLL
ncbi:glycerol-3-phosphate dehydrogenase/oxidase [Chloroflexota bacterium]